MYLVLHCFPSADRTNKPIKWYDVPQIRGFYNNTNRSL